MSWAIRPLFVGKKKKHGRWLLCLHSRILSVLLSGFPCHGYGLANIQAMWSKIRCWLCSLLVVEQNKNSCLFHWLRRPNDSCLDLAQMDGCALQLNRQPRQPLIGWLMWKVLKSVQVLLGQRVSFWGLSAGDRQWLCTCVFVCVFVYVCSNEISSLLASR